MKFSSKVFVYVAVLSATSNVAFADKKVNNLRKAAETQDETNAVMKEDSKYWSRFLVDADYSLPPPTRAPAVPKCLVDVKIMCVTVDGTACDELVGGLSDCLQELTYTYTFSNVGTNVMDITLATLTRPGEGSVDFLPEVPTTTLPPGASTLIEEVAIVDICVAGSYETTLYGEANPPGGVPCYDLASYVFTITPPATSVAPVTTATPAPVVSTPPPVDVTAAPVTPAPTTLAPVVSTPPPVDVTEAPVTPAPTTLAPVVSTPPPVVVTAAPVTPAPTTLAPVISTPPPVIVTAAPVTPAPTTLAPVIVTLAPTPDTCVVDIEVTCNDGNVTSCDAIIPPITQCLQRPNELIFKYNGGTCEQSFNIQPTTLFQCFDFNGGPPTAEGEESYLIVTDIKGQGIIYFEGFVAVGDEFLMVDGDNRVDANMNVTIYSSDDVQFANAIQTIVYHSSCSRNLFLKDRYGSIQLVIFVNDLQGTVSCFFNASFTFEISNSGEFDANFVSLISETNLGTFNFTDEVLTQGIAPGGTFSTSLDISLDLTVRQNYTVVTTIVGSTIGTGVLCSDTDTLTFEAGNNNTGLPVPIPI